MYYGSRKLIIPAASSRWETTQKPRVTMLILDLANQTIRGVRVHPLSAAWHNPARPDDMVGAVDHFPVDREQNSCSGVGGVRHPALRYQVNQIGSRKFQPAERCPALCRDAAISRLLYSWPAFCCVTLVGVRFFPPTSMRWK